MQGHATCCMGTRALLMERSALEGTARSQSSEAHLNARLLSLVQRTLHLAMAEARNSGDRSSANRTWRR
jgi:hypothetical protein